MDGMDVEGYRGLSNTVDGIGADEGKWGSDMKGDSRRAEGGGKGLRPAPRLSFKVMCVHALV